MQRLGEMGVARMSKWPIIVVVVVVVLVTSKPYKYSSLVFLLKTLHALGYFLRVSVRRGLFRATRPVKTRVEIEGLGHY